MKTKNIARAVILVAIAVALSPFFIPVGISKCFPAQHMVNVLAAVMLGPWYAVVIALVAGIIRNILGLGTILAFPGGLGEILGTGLLGALASAWIVGPIFMGKSMAVGTLIIAFSLSTLGGTIIGILALHLLRKVKIWQPEST